MLGEASREKLPGPVTEEECLSPTTNSFSSTFLPIASLRFTNLFSEALDAGYGQRVTDYH